MAIKTFYPGFTLLTGGTAAALDSIDGNSLVDGDVAVVLAAGYFYMYLLDAVSGAAESSPAIISPDTNAGMKRWIRQIVTTATTGQDSGTSAPVTGTWTRGWIRWNSEPTAGGVDHWTCVTAGTPGVWKEVLLNG